MKVAKMSTTDIVSLKPILTGGRLLDCFNNQNNNLNIIVLKETCIFNITITDISLKRPKARMIHQLTYPITDICNKIVKNERIILFTIGDIEFDIPIVSKDNNYDYHYEETCDMDVEIINDSNYNNALSSYHLSNYESVKNDLKHGIKLDCFGLFNKIITPTGKLAIVKGTSLLDNSTQYLIFEKVYVHSSF